MSTYSFDSITINGREVEIDLILKGSAPSKSMFETSTFSFIQQWFGNTAEFLQKTSGSTGDPKAITIKRQQMIASAQLTAQTLQLKSGDTALVCLDPEYIAGKMMFVRSFETGMKIIAKTPSLNPFLDINAQVPIDFGALVPIQLYELLQSDEVYRLDTLKNIIVGGAALHKDVQKQLAKFNCQVYASYGMTETISHIALQHVNGKKASKYFTVLPGVQINVDGRDCLEIQAPYLENKITTNDLVEIKDASQFKWLGRVDNIINSGGVKVIPEKIESEIQNIMESLNIHNRFLISGTPDFRLGNKIILLIEGFVTDEALENVKSSIKKALAPYEAPKEFYINVEFILAGNAKINRRATTEKLIIRP